MWKTEITAVGTNIQCSSRQYPFFWYWDGGNRADDSDRGYTVGTAEQPCIFIAEEDAEASPADAVEHEHDEACGYAPAEKGEPCTHEHDDVCGYGETVTPCTHTCEVCEVLNSGKPQEKVYRCPPVDSGEPVHGKDCPLYTAPEQSEAVKTLIAMVDALPHAAEITEENKEATIPDFEAAALNHIYTSANADVTVTATKIVNTSLSKEAQAATGGRPVYDFKVTGGGKNITTFGTGKISLSIPYPLQKVDGNGKPSETGSFENPGNLVGVYIDASGKPAYLPDSSYNVANKAMLINTTHLSLYGVAYKTNAPTFSDTANHWAKDDIQFVAARGLLTGTTATTFSPNTPMTRGMFVTTHHPFRQGHDGGRRRQHDRYGYP